LLTIELRIVPAFWARAIDTRAIVANINAYSVIVWPRELAFVQIASVWWRIDFPSQGGRFLD
jgi:hypothetical protein